MAADELLCWPSWMPLAQQADYSYQPTDRRTRTEMEVGSVLRVNFDTDETTLDCTLLCNTIQAQWLEQFERDILHQGSRWFRMPIQIAGCIEWHTVRFASRPKAGNLIGPSYTTYSFRLDIEKRALQLCPEILDFLFCVSPNDLTGTAKVLCTALHEVVPSIELPDFWLPSETIAVQEVA